MKKKNIVISLLIGLICILISFLFEVETNNIGKIEYINVNVEIDEVGNAKVTELWKCKTDYPQSGKATEWYRESLNIGNMQPTNVEVSEYGKDFKEVDRWSKFASKADKTGEYKVSLSPDSSRIIWGRGHDGNHLYKITYTLEDFIKRGKDAQFISWNFISDYSDVLLGANLKITIKADKKFEKDTLIYNLHDVGDIENYGVMVLRESLLEEHDDVTLLIKLPMDFAEVDNIVEKTFDEYYEMLKDEKEQKEQKEQIQQIVEFMLKIVICVIMFVGIYYVYFFKYNSKKYYANTNIVSRKIYRKVNNVCLIIVFLLMSLFGACYPPVGPIVVMVIVYLILASKDDRDIRGKINEKDITYYRDIPCDGEILKIYYIAYQYDIINKEADIIGAIILKWIKEKRIKFNKDNKSMLLDKEYDKQNWNNMDEKALYKMLYEASVDGVMEKFELERWSIQTKNNLYQWLKGVRISERKKLIEQGEIILEKTYKASESMLDIGKQIVGLKKYLKDFSIIDERETMEVHLFEDYLIMAQMLGIANQVEKELGDLYPYFIEEYKAENDII